MGDTQANQEKNKGRRLHRSRVDPGCGGCDHEDYRSCVPYPADKHITGMRETVFTDMLIKYMRLH